MLLVVAPPSLQLGRKESDSELACPTCPSPLPPSSPQVCPTHLTESDRYHKTDRRRLTSTGHLIPLLGFGVYQNFTTKDSVLQAFAAGYRCAHPRIHRD